MSSGRTAGRTAGFAASRVAGWTTAPAAVIAAHPRHRVLFAVVVGLLLSTLSRSAVVVSAVAGGALAASALHLTGRRLVVALAVPVAVLAGGLAGAARLAALEHGVLPQSHGHTLSVRATLLEPVRERGLGPAVARVRLLDGPALGEQAVLRVRPWARAGAWPEVGEIVAVRGEVTALGRFDAYQRRRGALAALDARSLRATGARRGGLAGVLDSVRRRAERGLERGLAPPEAALLRGMVLGQDERLTDDVRTDFQRSGLAHILAVSGQNVMLLATLVLAAGALTGMTLRGRLALALLLIAIYVPLTGAGPSIQRAGVMGAAGLVATLAGRPSSRWYALGLAAAATLALNPLVAGEPGWQLSFAAVVALLALGPPLRATLARRMPDPVADAAAITIAATLGTAPLMAYHFEQVSLASLPANLVAAPAIAPAMWLGMLAAAAAQLAPVLAVPFDTLNAPLLAFVEQVAHMAAASPGAVTNVHPGSPVVLALAYAVPIAAALAGRRAWRRTRTAAALRTRGLARPPTRIALAALVLVALGGAGVARAGRGAASPAAGGLTVSFLDVGQGDATLLQLDGTAVLFDTGPPGGPILSRLAEARVRRLDVLVLTHAQSDHEGSALPVIARYRPRLVLDGGAGWPTPVQRTLASAAARVGARVRVPRAGQALTLGRLRLRLLWPPAASPGWRPDGDPNQRALVAVASVGTFDLLLPSDAESDVTLPLDLPHVEALKVAHHGSADEGLPLLLRRLAPTVAAIEVGHRNPYGHPARAALAALRTVPHVYRTDRDGTVRLHVGGTAMSLERTGEKGG
jgi:competence protein ComEC